MLFVQCKKDPILLALSYFDQYNNVIGLFSKSIHPIVEYLRPAICVVVSLLCLLHSSIICLTTHLEVMNA